MATIKQYIVNMRTAQRAIGTLLGVDVGRIDKQSRVVLLAGDAISAVICKTLVDNGVITDAQLAATLDAAMADVYDDEPNEPG